jgi:hypothetical protein
MFKGEVKNMIKWLLKMKLKKLGYEWIQISEYALLDYRHHVKNNKSEDTWTLERKLNRNFYMAEVDSSHDESDGYIYKKFGALTIIYNKEQKVIVGITNHRGNEYVTEVDKELKNKLNKIYGLA